MYVFEEEKLIKSIEEKKPNQILLQLPEGLKKEGSRLATLIQEKTGIDVIVSGEPLWGACDVAIDEARDLGCDLIVMYGHAPFMNIKFPVIYLEARWDADIALLLKKALPLIKDKKNIALLSSVQHIHQIPIAKKLFESAEKKVLVPKAAGHAFYDGQVLGCEYTGVKMLASKADALVMIANKFHALGAALATPKPVILIDPLQQEVLELTSLREKIIKQRVAAVAKAQDARKIGVIIGAKIGQKFGSYSHIRERLKKLNKPYVLVSMGEVTNEKLINLHDIDAFVELACPRIAIDAAGMYEKPLLTAREFAVLCGELTWADLLERGFF